MPNQLPQKAQETIYRLSIRSDFRADVIRIREMFGLPVKGITRKEDINRWFRGTGSKNYSKFLDAYMKVMSKYKLPSNFCNLIEDHILHGGRFNVWPTLEEMIFCEMSVDPKQEERYRKEGMPFAKLLIFPGASQKFVKRYIEKNWANINKLVGKPGRVRVSKNHNRDLIIADLWSRSSKELGMERGAYKDIFISNLLRNKYDIVVSSDNVRKIASTMRKRSKPM